MLNFFKNTIKHYGLSSFQKRDVKTQQRILLSVFAVLICTILGVVFRNVITPSANQEKASTTFEDVKNITLHTSKDISDHNMSWRQQMEAENKKLASQIEELKKQKQPLIIPCHPVRLQKRSLWEGLMLPHPFKLPAIQGLCFFALLIREHCHVNLNPI